MNAQQLPFKRLTKNTAEMQTISAFIYGFSGAGKTYLARTALENPNTAPILVLMCDNGELTLNDLMDSPDLDVVRITSMGSFNNVFRYLANTKICRYKTVFIDNLTELQRKVLMTHAADNKQPDGVITQQDYGVTRNLILNLVSKFALNLRHLNVVFTSLAHNLQEEATGYQYVTPDLAGKLAFEVPGYCDIVGFLEVKTPRRRSKQPNKPHRILTVSQTTRCPTARNRGGFLPDEVIEPTIPLLLGFRTPSAQSKETA